MSGSTVLPNVSNQPEITYLHQYQVPPFLIEKTFLQVDLYDGHTFVTSKLTVKRNPRSTAHGELKLDGEDLILEEIKLNGTTLTSAQFNVTPKKVIIFNVPDQFELEIRNKIFPEKNTALSGLYRSKDTYCTQCEAEGFRRITYYLDQPDVLSRFTTLITADEKKYPLLLSNGNLIESGKLEQGRHFAKWEDPFKKPSYLFALVAGDFDLREDQFITQSNRAVQLKIFVEKGYRAQTEHAMYSLKQAMRWDEKTYGREYDLDIYMIVAINDFNMGAMENKGLNIFNTKYILAEPSTATDDDYIHILSVVGHEYFHNWSGNRVTCRDWFQLSLKEGLTIFRDQTFSEDELSKAVMRIREVTLLREQQFQEDAGPLAHPVRPESYIEINNFYTSTVYNKGAEVLRMLRTLLGTEIFRKGMDLYFERHDGHAVTIEDYISAMETVSNFDLTQFRLWYSQAGTPIVTATDDFDITNQKYRLTLTQSLAATPNQTDKKPMVIPVRMGLLASDGTEFPLHLDKESVTHEKVLILREASQTFEFTHLPSKPIPSLLRNFSSPVKLNYAYSDADLLFLFQQDKDSFNRWEALQKFVLRLILNLIRDHNREKILSIPSELIKAFRSMLEHATDDQLLLAEMLKLPSEKYIGEQMEVVDVDSIHIVREFVLNEIAKGLQPQLLKMVQHLKDTSIHYEFTMQAVGKRALKNRCLSYLLQLPQNAELGYEQFQMSLTNNMTDTQAALIGLRNLNLPQREKALSQFYTTWQNDALVVDKWLAIQAGSKLSDTLQRVKKLTHHPAFDIKNPNKVYALIGTFGQNSINFHVKTGEGYAFLRDIVQQLDKLNPQIASRMVKPLTDWKRYDEERQSLMKKQLELLLQNKISSDLYEWVSKSLY